MPSSDPSAGETAVARETGPPQPRPEERTPDPGVLPGRRGPALIAFLFYCTLAIVYTFPLVRHLADALPHDAADPVFTTWFLWWNARKLPLTAEWWNAPFFHPVPDAVAFSEHFLGIGLLASPAQWLGASPPLAYNLGFLLSFPLSALAAYLLCLALTGRQDAALIGGLAYGFAPYRVGQLAHLQVLSSYWMPLSLQGLHLYLRTRRARWLALFAGAWLAQSLCTGYFLFFFSVLIALWILWFARSPRDLAGIVTAWTLASVPLLPLLLEYREVQSRFGFVRAASEVESYAADVGGLLQGSPLLSHWRPPSTSEQEAWLFPGFTLPALVGAAVLGFGLAGPARAPSRSRARLVLASLAAVFALVALSGAILGPWHIEFPALRISVKALHKPLALAWIFLGCTLATSRRVIEARRRGSCLGFYVAATMAMWLLSLGPLPRFLGTPIWDKGPYWWLMQLPGVSGLRVPARFALLATLCLSVAGALALAAVLRRLRSGRSVLVALVALGIAWDGWITELPLVPVPAASPLAEVPGDDGSVLELPLGGLADAAALYRSLYHRRPVLNGYSSYYPPHYLPLALGLARQDDFLSSLPVRGPLYVVVDRGRDREGAWDGYVSRQRGARRVASSREASVYVVPIDARRSMGPERTLEIRSISANDQPSIADLMRDGDGQTRWTTSRPQRGTEKIVVDLGSVQPVGSVVLSLGRHVAEFPRELIIDASRGGSGWQEVWRGATAGLAMAACLEDPGVTPLRFDIGQRSARFLRLRLGSKVRRYHWSVTELQVRSPAVQ